ncbi:hypothetical protein C5S36_12810 [Candidatus Methanophagaceae archaeon]|nr:hypothetical protein C5S36_12810 [Methanophagales archaeon]
MKKPKMVLLMNAMFLPNTQKQHCLNGAIVGQRGKNNEKRSNKDEMP